MVPERLTFLYGTDVDPDEYDLSDLDVRSALLELSFEVELEVADLLVHEIVANQIFDDDPPEVWAAAARMLEAGLSREVVFRNLIAAFLPLMTEAIEQECPYDRDAHARALAKLPLPSADEVRDAITEVVSESQGIRLDEVESLVLARLGRDSDDDGARSMVELVGEMLYDDSGLVRLLAGDRVVNVAELTTGIVLTHRLSDAEKRIGVLNADFDLSGFTRLEEIRLRSGEPVEVFSVERGHLGWMGPHGWLDGFDAGAVIAVRSDPEGVVDIEVVRPEPARDAALVERMRGVYDREVDEPWLPVDSEALLYGLLLEDPSTFAEPVAPLAELADAAGLEVRLDEAAHEESVWHSALRMRRVGRILDRLDSDGGFATTRRVAHALDVADLLAGLDPSCVPEVAFPLDEKELREVLRDLRDEEVLTAFVEELLDTREPGAQHRADVLVTALEEMAKGRDLALVRLIAGLRAERLGDVELAEAELRAAHRADTELGTVVDHLAWYASLRGDAARAAQLWGELETTPALARDLKMMRELSGSNGPKIGRNEPCWCGSGRKYKQCHLGAVELPPLPDRIAWLYRKAVGYLERCGGDLRERFLDVVWARAAEPKDDRAVEEALDDPLVFDLVLTEGGAFEAFLEEFGSLLPDDEAMLASSWTLVDRSVHEIMEVSPGDHLVARDLSTGDTIRVRERTMSNQVSAGQLFCARAVPDGATHRFVGGVFRVNPGSENRVLELLDRGDPEEIAGWVAGSSGPPVLQTREGEPLVDCRVVLEVGDPDLVMKILEANYEPPDTEGEDPSWLELHPIDELEQILRAHLRPEGSRIVVSTNSEERADRIISTIRAGAPDAVVVEDVRRPMDFASLMHRKRLEERLHPGEAVEDTSAMDDPEALALMAEMRERFEERWCDESIPALGGLTPRQAAADPTRREQLDRLLVSFEQPMGNPDVAMRPSRLRELLGI